MLDYIEQIHRGLIGILFVEKLFTRIKRFLISVVDNDIRKSI